MTLDLGFISSGNPIRNKGLLSSGCIVLRVLVRLSCTNTILDSSPMWEEVAQFMIRGF